MNDARWLIMHPPLDCENLLEIEKFGNYGDNASKMAGFFAGGVAQQASTESYASDASQKSTEDLRKEGKLVVKNRFAKEGHYVVAEDSISAQKKRERDEAREAEQKEKKIEIMTIMNKMAKFEAYQHEKGDLAKLNPFKRWVLGQVPNKASLEHHLGNHNVNVAKLGPYLENIMWGLNDVNMQREQHVQEIFRTMKMIAHFDRLRDQRNRKSLVEMGIDPDETEGLAKLKAMRKRSTYRSPLQVAGAAKDKLHNVLQTENAAQGIKNSNEMTNEEAEKYSRESVNVGEGEFMFDDKALMKNLRNVKEAETAGMSMSLSGKKFQNKVRKQMIMQSTGKMINRTYIDLKKRSKIGLKYADIALALVDTPVL